MTADDLVAALLKLVGAGRIDETRTLLQQAPALINAVGPHPFWGGRPQPLHVAIANTRAADQSRQTALHSAAWNGDLEMVRLLVAGGADPAARDEEHDNTPQGWAETSLKITNNQRCAVVAAWLSDSR